MSGPEPSTPGPSDPPEIRAVLLDAGNTLVFVDRERLFSIFAEVGVEGDERRFVEAELEARLNLTRRVEAGDSGTEAHVWKEYFYRMFAGCGVPEGVVEQVGQRLREEHEREHLWTRVEEGTAEALARARETGVRLGVISNADGRVEALLRKVGLRGEVEFVVDSHVVGVEKPDPRIFLEGVRRMGLRPDECLYVGDLYPVDVVGARRVGMRALLLDPTGRLDRPVPRIPSVLELPEFLDGG